MSSAFKIMIVEDCKSYRQQIVQTLGAYADLDAFQTFDEAKAAIEKKTYDVYVLDKQLPDGCDGENLLPIIRADNPNAIIIMLTVDSDYNTAKRCLAHGADEYIIKAPNIVPELLVRIPITAARSANARHLHALEEQIKETFKYEIVGKSQTMAMLRAEIYALKNSHSTVLITGESGTGKDLVARRIHAIEDGGPRPFVIVNCAAIPDNLIESELFGCKRGAFTGATTDRPGKFELAHNGDIFLDEIGELPLQAQAKLLRVIQDGQFFRIGGERPIQVSCRVIAATNANLERLVRKRKFREDLFYRLNVMRFNLVPLRERLEDVPDMARFFLIQEGGPRYKITERALKRLMQHRWPGNVRELRNSIERAVILVRQRESLEVDADDIRFDKPEDGPGAAIRKLEVALPTEAHELSSQSYQDFMALAEREYLRNGLGLIDGNAADLAQRIRMGRGTIYKKMAEFGIPRRSYESREANVDASGSEPVVKDRGPGLKEVQGEV